MSSRLTFHTKILLAGRIVSDTRAVELNVGQLAVATRRVYLPAQTNSYNRQLQEHSIVDTNFF
jgi:hypothetical protein